MVSVKASNEQIATNQQIVILIDVGYGVITGWHATQSLYWFPIELDISLLLLA